MEAFLKFLFIELPLHLLVEVVLPGILAVGIIAFIIFAAIALIQGAFMLLVLLVGMIREKIHPKKYFPFNCKGCSLYDAKFNRCKGIPDYLKVKFPTTEEDCMFAKLEAEVQQQISERISQKQNNGDGE